MQKKLNFNFFFKLKKKKNVSPCLSLPVPEWAGLSAFREL
jgi:hypothetical protein